MLKYSVLTFLLQLLCYTAILHKCKLKSNWVMSKENNLSLMFEHFPPWKKSVDVTFIYDSQRNQILKPWSFPEDGMSGFWLPLLLVRLWDGWQCWWCRRNRTDGAQHTTRPEVSALYRSIQVPQKLHSAGSLENSLLTHSSCFFFPNLLFGCFFLFFFQGLFSLFLFLSLLNALVSVMISVGGPYVG